MNKSNLKHSVNIGLVIIACLLAYLPGLTDFMLVDDKPNIVQNGAIKISQLTIDNLVSAATGNQSGPIGRPLPSLSFALNYYFSGQQLIPSHFKATNLVIHIANSILIYALTLILLSTINRRASLIAANKTLTLALLITLLWALHPIQLTAVLYSVQRMTSMATFFMLAGLITYMLGRHRLEKGRPHALTLMYGGIISGTVLGGLCKEIALLLPFYAMAVEASLYYKADNPETIKKKLRLFQLTIAVIPAIIGIIYLATHPELIFSGYTFRDFTLVERLMTEARVLFYYIGLIIYPDISQLTLHHDDIAISRNLVTPLTTILSIAGIIFLLLAAWFVRKKHAVFSFMVMWFFVGHAMESTFFGLEIAYEHRNYLPSYGIIFGIIIFSYSLLQNITNKQSLKVALASVALASMFLATFTRASIWSDEATISHFDARNHPESARSQTIYADQLLNLNKPLPQVYEHLRIAASLTTAEIGPAIHQYKLLKLIGRNISIYSDEYIANTQSPVSYDSPLIINSDYIKDLEALIDKEIQRRLRGKIATHRAAMALRAFANCVLANRAGCKSLSAEAINWLTIMTSNARHTPMTLGMTYFHLAKLKAYTGDLDSAFDYVEKSLVALPDDVSILIERINLYITLGDKKKANELIQEFEKRDNVPEIFRLMLNRSKEHLQTKGNSDTDTSTPIQSN